MSTKLKLKKALPNSIPALIEAAVADAKRVQRSKRYMLDMGVYHEPNGKCRVCMAGALLISRGVSDKIEVWPDQFDRATERKLRAIDFVREGDVISAYNELGMKAPRSVEAVERRIQDGYSFGRDGGRAPWSVYLKAAKMLREGAK